jgi:hypothetical protein
MARSVPHLIGPFLDQLAAGKAVRSIHLASNPGYNESRTQMIQRRESIPTSASEVGQKDKK